MASKGGFSIADLQQGAKKLNTVDQIAETKSNNKNIDFDESAIEPLEKLYNKYDGDLDLIFNELKANPSKAKKPHHRPKSSKEFAVKYLQGFYSVIEDDNNADSKSHK
mmetsp:Transcript_9031/g.8057  ORF Transcript_9031/g.8057 Transcript_9031/m.8057 type:complete len:108 (-) Transcript_9031:112-435(-)